MALIEVDIFPLRDEFLPEECCYCNLLALPIPLLAEVWFVLKLMLSCDDFLLTKESCSVLMLDLVASRPSLVPPVCLRLKSSKVLAVSTAS